MPTVSVIIPFYNEPQPPAALVDALRAQVGAEADILVVDDGSQTPLDPAVLAGKARVLRLPVNRGYGAAIKAGLQATAGDRVAIIDSDGTYPSEVLPRLLGALDTHEMAVGARTGRDVHITPLRRVVKGTLTRLASFLSEQTIPDINSGLRAFRRESVIPYLRLLPNRFSLTTTVTLAFLCDGRPVHFEPIDYHPRVGQSHWKPIRDTREFILTILRTIFLFNPMRVCLPLALTLWVLGAAVFLISWLWGHRIMDGTVSVLALGGLQVLVVGLLAEVMARRD
jgi:glycosyltransferase involved in cell wall biosynthesis